MTFQNMFDINRGLNFKDMPTMSNLTNSQDRICGLTFKNCI